MRNLFLIINQATLYIRDTKNSSKELLDLYKSEKIVKIRTDHKFLRVKTYNKLDSFIKE